MHAAAFGPRKWDAGTLAEMIDRPAIVGWGQPNVGFALFQISAPEAELLTLAVDPDHQRQGHGRQILQHSFEQLPAQAVRTVVLEVAEDNTAARRLYDGFNATEVGRRAAYYPHPTNSLTMAGRVDALVMAINL